MKILDFSQLSCPIPLVQTKLFVKSAPKGTICQIILADTGSRQDVPAMLHKLGHHVEITPLCHSNKVQLEVTLNG